MMLNNGVV